MPSRAIGRTGIHDPLRPGEPHWSQHDVTVPTWYVHFTDATSANAIVASGELWLSATVTNAVFAAAVGGRSVPSVQYATRRVPAPMSRSCAVLFRTADPPDRIFPEEVVWHRTNPLPVADTTLLTARAADEILDDTLGIPEDGWWHTRDCACGPCRCWARTNRW